MGVIERFQNLFRPRAMQDAPVTLAPAPARPSSLVSRFSVESGRRAMVEDARKMYEEDPRADGVISTVARDALRGGFDLAIDGPRADEAQAVADELLERLDFFSRADDWTRLAARDGDSLLEVAADAAGRIVHVSRKPTLEMHRWSNEYDLFDDPARAFFWTDQLWSVSDSPPAKATFFAEWQIIHARYKRDEGSRYGRPMFSSGRRAYKRFSEGELDISIRRKTRAGMKYVHSLEDASDADVQAYQTRNKAPLGDPFAAVADFFSNKRTTIQSIQGDARLGEIDDVLHHIDTWAVAGMVPLELIGYGRNINRDVLEQKKEQYDESIMATRAWVEAEILKPLLERQWLLLGIWPASLTWAVEWTGKKQPGPTQLKEAATALVALRASGLFQDETLLRLFAMFVPGFEADGEIEALASRVDDMPGRIGAEANAE